MRLTRHNGRTGRDGVFCVKHNDRNFDSKNADHITPEQSINNVYWDIFNNLRLGTDQNQELESFDDVERRFYKENFSAHVEAQNARNIKAYHPERNQTTEDIRHNVRTCPEETVYQIGKRDEHVDPDILLAVVTEFTNELTKRYGSHFHILDWSLHLDESCPHVHERHVFSALNQNGELVPSQDRALEALGFELPDTSKKKSRYNNRKMSFDSTCRNLLFEVAKKHGLTLEEEPVSGGRKHMEKNEYIISQQEKQISEQQATIDNQRTKIESNNKDIANQTERLTELTIKVDNINSLITDISETAYDAAVEVVTETACTETQKADVQEIERMRDWLLEPGRKASQETKEYAVKCLGSVANRIKKAATQIMKNIKQVLLDPVNKSKSIQKIEERATKSILAKLGKYRREISEHDTDSPFKIIENERVL